MKAKDFVLDPWVRRARGEVPSCADEVAAMNESGTTSLLVGGSLDGIPVQASKISSTLRSPTALPDDALQRRSRRRGGAVVELPVGTAHPSRSG